MSTGQLNGKPKDKNQHIKVFVRIRPLNEPEKVNRSVPIINCPSHTEILVRERPSDKLTKKFTFDRTFDSNSKQVDVYKYVVSPLINEVLAGYNCTVFAYGQTGTGKTFTMEGERSDDPSMPWHVDPQIGLIPRAMSHMFDELRILQAEYSVRVSFLELYNEELFDLLSSVDDNSKLKLFEDATKKGAVIVSGLEEVTVHNKNEVYQIMEKGSLKRQTAATLMNAHSSRSHTVFTITVHIKENSVGGDELIKIGKLNLVDLAGSENIGRSGAVDKRAREAGNINQSLLTLGRVITALVERTPHVPYRESKLTRLLQESLGGRTKTSIIATVSPALYNSEESLSTLDYAHRAKSITNRPEVNQKLAKKALIKEYTEEIDRLRRDLKASRDRNGIFLAAQNYEDMLIEIESQKAEMGQLLVNVKTLEESIETRNTLNLELSEMLQAYKDKLQETSKLLDETETDRSEKVYLLEQHVQTEAKLSEQACNLLAVAEESTSQNMHLHDSLERKRLLELRNTSVCTSFEVLVKENLPKIEQSVTQFSVEAVEAADRLKCRLRDCYNRTVNISNDMTNKIFSMINNQIEVVAEMDNFAGEISHTREYLTQLPVSVEETRVFAVTDIKHYATKVQEENEALHRQNILLKEETCTMKEEMDTQIEANVQKLHDFTTKHSSELQKIRNESLRVLEQLKQQTEAIASTRRELNQTQAIFAQEMGAHILDTMNMFKSYCATTEKDLSQLHDAVSMEQEISDNLVIKLTADVDRHINSVEEFSSDCRTSMGGLNEVIDLFAGRSVSVLDSTDHSCTAVEANIENMVSSASNQLQENVDKLDSDFQSMSSALADIEEKQRKQNMELASTLKDSIPVHREMQQNRIRNMSSLVTSCVGDLDMHCAQVGSMLDSVQTDIGHMQGLCDKFIQQDLQTYVATGSTPERQEFSYPRDLAATSPHDHLVSRFQMMNCLNDLQEEETLGESFQTEENEGKENSRFYAPIVIKAENICQHEVNRSVLTESNINRI